MAHFFLITAKPCLTKPSINLFFMKPQLFFYSFTIRPNSSRISPQS